jgi:excisionase family DNA binding protein
MTNRLRKKVVSLRAGQIQILCYSLIHAKLRQFLRKLAGGSGWFRIPLLAPMFHGYIRKTEMAARMQVTPRTIDSWMAKRLVPFRKIGRTVRFDWDEVCEHLRARNQPPLTTQVRQTGTGIATMLRQKAAEIRRSTR